MFCLKDTPRYQKILTGLNDVAHLCYSGIPEVAIEARAILRPLLQATRRRSRPQHQCSRSCAYGFGLVVAHRETIRKGARTFSTSLELMDRYPDYIFGASQPQYFQWMKDSLSGTIQAH